MIFRLAFGSACLFCSMSPLPAAVIGTNTPSQTVTAEAIARLPTTERPAWAAYLKRSTVRMRADQDFLKAEMKAQGLTVSTNAPGGRSWGLSRFRTPEWYAGDEARRLADIVVSFQTPAGGWSKNLDLTRHIRAPGEHFAPDNRSQFARDGDFDAPLEGNWSYVGTFDNGATTMELRFLAKVINALPEENAEAYRKAFLRGLDYIFEAQYPNGGWPQVWPLQGGYHDAITCNDGGILHVLELLNAVSAGRDDFAFVPATVRTTAAGSLKRGVECILNSQIVEDGRPTVWCQQHDPLTLEPTSARNYEMPSACSAESAGIMMFLMQLPDPDSQVVRSVQSAATWFERTKLLDVAWRNTGARGRLLVPAPGQGPLWARYYSLETDQPIFGDRDKTIHDTVEEISAERRRGYAWFVDSPKQALDEYQTWSKAHPGRERGG